MNLSIASLYKEYFEGASLIELGKKYEMHPNTLARKFKKAGYKLRTQSEAQKNALKKGKKHPTAGRSHSEETRKQIGASVSQAPSKKRSKAAKARWQKLSDEYKKNLVEKAHKGMRLAAEQGSQLELLLVDLLTKDGYQVTWHAPLYHVSAEMHVDILVHPQIVIEVDGPTHYKPIWGEEKLEKVQESDHKKNGILLTEGYTVIRVKHLKKTTSNHYAERIYNLIKPLLQQSNELHYVGIDND